LNEENNAHKKQTVRVTRIVKKLTLILYSLLWTWNWALYSFDLGAVSTLGTTGSFRRGLHSGVLGADIQMLLDR